MEINMFESEKEKYSTGLAIDSKGKLISIGSCSDTNLIIPNNVKEISYRAFKNNNEIESIVISDSVEIIGWDAFEGCASLRKVMLGKNVERIGNSAFKDCVTLETIEIPDSIKSIGASAFSGCKSLEYNEEYSDYGTMYYLGNKTNNYLYLCSVERSIHLFDEPKKKDVIVDINRQCRIIGVGAFREYGKNVSFLELTSATIPDSVIDIGDNAFSGCSNLTSVTIGKNVERIGEDAFSCCDNLRKIYFNSEKCTSVGNKAFSCNIENKLGVDIYINDDIKELPYEFLNCFKKRSNIYEGKVEVAKVNSLHLGKGITDIKEAAFERFKGLTYIVFGENVKTIGARCFYDCEIRNIVLPDSVEYIGGAAFDSSLRSITLGKGIKKIDDRAFTHCQNLSHVNYTGTLEQWVQIEFQGFSSNPLTYTKELYINNELVTEEDLKIATEKNNFAVKEDLLKEIDVSQNKDEERCAFFDEFENVDTNKNNYKAAEDNDEKRNFKSNESNKFFRFLRIAIIVGVIVEILLKVKDCIVATLYR